MKKIIIFFLSATLFSLISCQKDVLDKLPLDIISDGVVWSDPALIDAYLTQTYAQMYILTNETPGSTTWADNENSSACLLVNELSDECKNNWWATAPYAIGKFGSLQVGGGVLEWWEQSYSVIRSLNIFIESVPTAPVEDVFKKTRTAEARFLRAFNYFAMVKRYGGVAIITKAQAIDAPKDELYPKRDTEQAVYDFIISEMDAASPDLPEVNTTDYGRPTKYAAIALKCRAALYAASIAKFGTVRLGGIVGIDAAKATSYYQIAFDAAKTIMNSGKYTLYNKNADKVMNFRNLFVEKNNSELIFVKRHTFTDAMAGGNGWAWDFLQAPVPNVWGGGNNDGPYLEMAEEFEHVDGTSGKLDRATLGTNVMTPEELWANKDPRFYASIYTHNSMWKGNKLDFHNSLVDLNGNWIPNGSSNGIPALGSQIVPSFTAQTGFGVMKYLDESKPIMEATGTSGSDWIVFRYGEILLNCAEAAFELGKTSDALDAINQIRTRAGIATISSVDREKIRHERKVELAFEGHRYWDLRRLRTATTDLTRDYSGLMYILDLKSGKYFMHVVDKIDGAVSKPTFYDRNYYLPITLGRTGNNPNLVENPGYN